MAFSAAFDWLTDFQRLPETYEAPKTAARLLGALFPRPQVRPASRSSCSRQRPMRACLLIAEGQFVRGRVRRTRRRRVPREPAEGAQGVRRSARHHNRRAPRIRPSRTSTSRRSPSATRSGPMRSACSLTRTSTTRSSRSRCSHLSPRGSRAPRHEAQRVACAVRGRGNDVYRLSGRVVVRGSRPRRGCSDGLGGGRDPAAAHPDGLMGSRPREGAG